MSNKQENLVFICRQNRDIRGTMKAQWNKSETWNVDTHTVFSKRIERTKRKMLPCLWTCITCFSLQGKLRSWLLDCLWVKMRKEQDGCLGGDLLEKAKS